MDEALEAAVLGGAGHNEIEFVILNDILGINVPVDRGDPFNLNDMLEEDVRKNFRFNREDIFRLARALRIPAIIHTENRNCVSGVTGLCILLRRLAYLCRLKDLEPMFSCSSAALSQIINHMQTFLAQNFNNLLENLGNLQWLNMERMELYAQAVQAKGGAVPNCWGFIDGTARPICKPSENQEDFYSGHKRLHCLKYQSVLCPDGIIASLKGSYLGRRHDARILRESNLYQELEAVAVFPNNRNFVLYGDQAYPIMELLLCPYPTRENMPPHQQRFNASMKVLRVAVEWGFGKVVSQFAFLDFKKNQKLLLQNVAVLLCNCHTCLYGSQTSQYFNVVPPVLEEYLGNN